MKLGVHIGYWGLGLTAEEQLKLVREAESLGYDSVWTAEAYGSDAITPLAYIAAHTKRIRLGTGIMQLAGRAPAMCAMQVATVDALSGGGRMIAGLGVSGPQIVEGWYGQPWGRPYYRLKDYVQIMKKVLARAEPVTHDGKEFQLPFKGPGAMGIGKPLKSILHTNPNIPIWLGSGTETNVRLAAEVADGILPLGFVPATAAMYKPWIEEGFARAGNGKSWKDFEIQASTTVIITDDVRAAFRQMKPGIALYVGGMGHSNKNFHNDMMVRRGYGDAAKTIQELYLAGRKGEAIEAVPDEFCDDGSLVGPVARIKERYREWEDAGVTGLTIGGTDEAIELMADITGASKGALV
jgi:F420-dependent oxidoreductase-like protein